MAADRYLKSHGAKFAKTMQLGSNEAIKQAVAGGLGVAILSQHALQFATGHDVEAGAFGGSLWSGRATALSWRGAAVGDAALPTEAHVVGRALVVAERVGRRAAGARGDVHLNFVNPGKSGLMNLDWVQFDEQ